MWCGACGGFTDFPGVEDIPAGQTITFANCAVCGVNDWQPERRVPPPMPRWLRDWRCPHCGAPARSWECTGENQDGEITKSNIFTCMNGHRRYVAGDYDTGGL
jgi:hypothetical protein